MRPSFVLVPLGVLVAGFGALLLFWIGGEPRVDVPGLFDYAAATLGDGLLLPLLALACVFALAWVSTPAPNERNWTLIGALGGVGVGATIQAVWILDPSPHLNWTLVAPHELNTAGWWHTAFFVLASGFFSGCAMRIALRVRSADAVKRRALAECGWLAIVAFCGLGFLGLAATDNLAANGTQAGLATAVGVTLAAGLFLVGTAWAFRFTFREIASPLLAGLGAAAGIAMLTSYGLPIALGGVIVGAAISAGLGVGLMATAFASIEAAADRMRAQLWVAAALPALLNALTLAGTLSLGLHLAGNHGLAAAAVVLAGATLVTLTSRDLEQSAGNLALRATAVAYSVGLIVLAGWVGEGRTSAQANYAVGFAAFFLDGLVLGMIREQFANVIRSDVAGEDAAGRKTEEVGLGTIIQVFTFGLAALSSLATLFAIAAPQLGLDVGSGFPDVDFARLGVALALALALTAAARLTAKHVDSARKKEREKEGETVSSSIDKPPPQPGERVQVDGTATALAATGLVIWLGALIWSAIDAGLNMVPAAAIGAGLIGAMVAEDIIRSGARLQLHSPDRQSWLLAAAAGAAVAAGLFFVLATALWDEGAPASGSATMAALLIPAATIFVAWLGSTPVAYGLVHEKITPQTPDLNLLLVEGLYAGLALIALIIPMMAVSRIDALDPSDVGLVAVTALAALPPMIGAFVWVLGNNTLHLELQLRKLDKLEEEEALPVPLRVYDPKADPSPSEQWKSWMSTHIRFQNRVSVGVMVAAFAWTAVEILL
ncbi:MAG TPA: hypothetical protein VF729_08580 [Solirubrobacterales bacterium]